MQPPHPNPTLGKGLLYITLSVQIPGTATSFHPFGSGGVAPQASHLAHTLDLHLPSGPGVSVLAVSCPDPDGYKQIPLYHPICEKCLLRKKTSKYPTEHTSSGIRQAGAQIPVSRLLALWTWTGSVMTWNLLPHLCSELHDASSRAEGLRRTVRTAPHGTSQSRSLRAALSLLLPLLLSSSVSFFPS